MYNLGLSGQLWPAHPKPRENELLSSWITRIARAHKIKVHTLCHLTWPGKQIWNRDIDKSASSEIISILSTKTGTPIETVQNTILSSYQHSLIENFTSIAETPWIMSVGVYHRVRKKYGLQFCPKCLADGETQYYRKQWRLALSIVCPIHRMFLLDRCPNCRSQLCVHRISLEHPSLSCCYNCGFDLAESESTPCSYREAGQQEDLYLSINRGWVWLSPTKRVYSYQYFVVVRHLIKLLQGNSWGKKLSEYIHQVFPEMTADFTAPPRHQFERLEVKNRHCLLKSAIWLLEDWPLRIVTIAQLSGSTWSSYTSDMKTSKIPYWYYQQVKDHLFESNYIPTDDEIRSAIAYLKNKGTTPFWKDICKLLGHPRLRDKNKQWKKFGLALN